MPPVANADDDTSLEPLFVAELLALASPPGPSGFVPSPPTALAVAVDEPEFAVALAVAFASPPALPGAYSAPLPYPAAPPVALADDRTSPEPLLVAELLAFASPPTPPAGPPGNYYGEGLSPPLLAPDATELLITVPECVVAAELTA